MNAVKFNQQLDSELLATGIVSRELYFQFAEAQAYDAASSVGWLEAKLSILVQRLDSGGSAQLYDPASQSLIPCTTTAELATWAAHLFPSAVVKMAGAAT